MGYVQRGRNVHIRGALVSADAIPVALFPAYWGGRQCLFPCLPQSQFLGVQTRDFPVISRNFRRENLFCGSIS